MKVFQIRFPLILLFFLAVFSLTNCGQEKNDKTTESNVDTLNQDVKIAPDAVDSQSMVPVTQDNNQNEDSKEQENNRVAKKVTGPVTKLPPKQIIVTAKKPASNKITTPVNKPVQPAATPPPVKVPEPLTPATVSQPKPAEPAKPATVVVSKPVQDNWVVPAKYKSMISSYPDNPESLARGKTLYSTHCKSCHGSKGDGNGTKAASIDTKIRSFLSSGFKAQNQGEVFYKSVFGRKDMPTFNKKIPDDEEQWALVHYIMSL